MVPRNSKGFNLLPSEAKRVLIGSNFGGQTTQIIDHFVPKPGLLP